MSEFSPLIQEELLGESLSDAEVREILTRLSAKELGGPETPTVAGVCEATGATPEVIGRILADIRQVDIIDRFGKVLQRHEARISHLESKTDRMARKLVDQAPRPRIDPVVSAKMQEIAECEIAGEKALPWVLIGLIVFLFLMAPMMCPSPRANQPDSERSSTPSSGWPH